MQTHACGSCGKMLNPSMRSFSTEVRMWIAVCPRCGFAVRCNLRAARAPFRLWARSRGISTRLGFLLGGSIVTGFSWVVICEHTLNTMPRWSASGHSALIAPLADSCSDGSIIGVIVAAVFAMVTALSVAPHRSALSRLCYAWTVGALPVIFALSLADGGIGFQFDLDRAWTSVLLVTPMLATLVVLSAVLVAIACPIYAAIQRHFNARYRRMHRESSPRLSLSERTT